MKDEITVSQDELFMAAAIREARRAWVLNEVPIGAVIVHDGEIIGKGFNLRESMQATLTHAELLAMQEANNEIGSWRLEDCTLYVTLEPCPMCAGAIVQSRMKRVVYGAPDTKAGCAGTLMNLLNEPQFNHQVEVTSGILEQQCSTILKEFFKELREKKSKNTSADD
ncbi:MULTISPECIES: tRNA adenosine(34) deaminase TadA [Oceanobacillus]|uniref:tRNA adenosine(34) deaminase TadA n=1 Tax=Oceanobacillus TaxID=182709 RepID=UPI000A07C7E7|nr:MULTISPECIES: tRNA adenosine(34) deaminase TadA [Oceanobacillus]MBT2599873.1 tRNA adenosine(34) deaminase TadA [Oceanobacillus sp. ISL-74]MBT2652677.1 tRNA adenosine(34) deaminase TadA [Oceanobacillus sp. ISL-73]